MKSTLFGLLFVSFIIAGCGKDSGGGGSSSTMLGTNSSNLSSTAVAAAQSFQSWYESASEPSVTVGPYVLTKTSSASSNSGSNCSLKTWGIFSYYSCSSSSSSSSSGSTSTTCGVTVYSSASSLKGHNPVLAGLYNGTLGTLINGTQNGSNYNFTIQKPNGHVITYVINTQYPSAFQPVQVQDTETASLISVTNAVYGSTTTTQCF